MRKFSIIAALAVIVCIGSFARAAERPNIVFVFTDDHAPHAIGAYNGWLKSVNPTPTIDRLAAQGMLFENSFCTNSICGPSRAVIQTGKHSHRNGFMNNGNTFDWNQQTFPKLLQKAGYQTAIYGKSHLKGTLVSHERPAMSFQSLFCRVGLCGLLVLQCLTGSEQTHAADQPNIVMFLVDDMGPMDTSVPFMLGEDGKPKRYPLNDYYRTPSMERLAAQGTRLNNFYAMSVCSPTRTSIVSGQNAARHRVTQWIRSEGNNKGDFGPPQWNWSGFSNAKATLPGVLKTAGYHTIYIGKAHFGPIGKPTELPSNLGYDVNIGGCSWGQPGSYYGQDASTTTCLI